MSVGVFIIKRMGITIPAGTDFFSGSIAIQAHYDVCPSWLKLSVDHLRAAKKCRDDREVAWQTEDAERKASTLEREFEASMQAIVSAAIAIDAFYAVVKDKAGLPPSGGKGRPSRHAQVCETIKQAFKLKSKGFDMLRENVEKIYRLRDLAVHPKGSAGDTIVHPELGGVGVEWRIAYFRYTAAFGVVRFTVGVLNDLATNGKPITEALKTYMQTLKLDTNVLFDDPIFVPREEPRREVEVLR
jgi:hypothetical protein